MSTTVIRTGRSGWSKPTRSRKARSTSLRATALPEPMVQSIVLSGLAIGCIYALTAIAYNVMFSASRVFSFTAGTLGMVGGILGALFILRLGMPIWVGVLLALVAAPL